MNKKISVIVPIHNAEKYLESCLDSLVVQSYRNLEIILVNDLSTDSSAAICDRYAQRDERVRVIHKTQKGGEGGAVARNEGIAAATGELFYFMDSDDYIEEDMLEKMNALMEQEQSDCVVSSFHYVDSEGKELPWYTPQLSKYNCVTGKEAAAIFLTTRNIEGFSWNKLIKREVLENYQISFDESMNSFVDMYGMFRAILYSRRVSFYDAKPYYYRQHSVSCVHTMSMRKLGNFKRVTSRIRALAQEQGLLAESDFFYKYRMIMQLFDVVKAKQSYMDVWEQIKKDFSWKECIGASPVNALRQIVPYADGSKIKMGARILTVWFHFK